MYHGNDSRTIGLAPACTMYKENELLYVLAVMQPVMSFDLAGDAADRFFWTTANIQTTK
jgi:hypothetical protein